MQQNIQGQSYSGHPTQQIVNNNVPAQGQTYAGQIPRSVTTNVPTQAPSYVGPTSQNTTVNVSAQGAIGTIGRLEGYSQSIGSQNFTNQQTQTTYVQPAQNQTYVQQTSQQTQQQQQPPAPSNVPQQQNQQSFHTTQAQGQSYQISQAQAQPQTQSQSQPQPQTQPQPQPQSQTQTQPPPQQPIYSQNISGATTTQNFVVSMPSSPASVPQQPVYPSASQQTTKEPVSTYSQPPLQQNARGVAGNYIQAVTQATSSSVYTTPQFKAQSTPPVVNDGSSPSEPSVISSAVEGTDTNITDETQTVLDDTDRYVLIIFDIKKKMKRNCKIANYPMKIIHLGKIV